MCEGVEGISRAFPRILGDVQGHVWDLGNFDRIARDFAKNLRRKDPKILNGK